MRLSIIILLLFLGGCVKQICVDKINVTDDNKLSFDKRSLATDNKKVFSRSLSVNGEVMTLQVYQADDKYFVRYHPAIRNAEYYGPFPGNGLEAISCDTKE